MLFTIGAAFAGALVYATAAVCGLLAATALLPKLHRFEDGPEPFSVHPAWLVGASALLGAIMAFKHVPIGAFAIGALVTIALVGIFECDARTGIVPDVFTLVPLAILIADSIFLHQFVMPAISALVVFTPFAIAALVTRGHGMGWGDAKLAALGGALLGMFAATLAFGIASLAAVIVASVKYRSAKVPVAFAPYLVGAIAVSMALQAR